MIKILIVDDSEVQHEYMGHILEKSGYVTYFAFNGKTGTEKALELKPDLVLMDMDMPVMNGFEATKSLREQGYKGLIVACTSSMQEEKIMATGCNALIKKPFESKELLERIKDILWL